jgi:glutamate dehydrogenase
MQFLEKTGRLHRAIEFLPSDEQIAELRLLGQGLATPERAVLLAYSKIWLYDELLASTLPDDPWVATALQRYFPPLLQERFGAWLPRHPLKREIIATHVTNSMLNRVGSTFVYRLVEATGAPAHEVVRAYLLSREIFGLVSLWQGVEALDNLVPDELQSQMLIQTSNQLERGTTWLLRSKRLGDDMAATIGHFQPGVEALAAGLPALLDADGRAGIDADVAAYVARGVPRELAQQVVSFDSLQAALDIAEAAGPAGAPVEAVARLHFAVGNLLGLPWLREMIAALPGDQHWRMLARSAMQDDLAGLQRSITAAVLVRGRSAEAADADSSPIEAWQQSNRRALDRALQLLGELRAVPQPDSAMLSVVLRELRALA